MIKSIPPENHPVDLPPSGKNHPVENPTPNALEIENKMLKEKIEEMLKERNTLAKAKGQSPYGQEDINEVFEIVKEFN